MGCSESTCNSSQESVALCKHRRLLIKQAVRGRRLLASAHTSYIISLKNAGAALADYAHGEDIHPPPEEADPPIHQPPIENLPPPPPLPSKFIPSNLPSSSSGLPHLPTGKTASNSADSIVGQDDFPREESLDFSFVDDGGPVPILAEVEESPSYSIDKHCQEEDPEAQDGVDSMAEKQNSRGRQQQEASLSIIIKEVDDHFLKASESARQVLKMLDHSNFSDARVGQIDDAALVMRIITWNHSMVSDDCGVTRESDTLAMVLDKSRAWEKKLLEEVKTSEVLKVEYQRKVASLATKQKIGSNVAALQKAIAAASHLQSRHLIAVQSVDATLSEIQRLRDEQLYPLLQALVDGYVAMWEKMHAHHMAQLNIVMSLKCLEIWNMNAPNCNWTRQLCVAIQDWNSQFRKLMAHQKEYVEALQGWSKSNLNCWASRENVAAPLPIHALLQQWHEQLEKLPAEVAGNAISSFGANVEAILAEQQEEMRQREKCEETRKECGRKMEALEERRRKHMERRDGEGIDGEGIMECLKKKMQEEEATHLKLCRRVREKFIGSMKNQLPELFRALSDFSMASWEMHKNIWASSRSNFRSPLEYS
ncbi:hypothetical protein ACLOJK_038175 [Asimina triloba]